MKLEGPTVAAEIRDAKDAVGKIDGWLSDREVEFLYRTARSCSKSGVIVEIGSFKGKSTVSLAMGSRSGGRVEVYAIDPHAGTLEQGLWLSGASSLEDFRRNVSASGVERLVVPIVARSEVAGQKWRRPISFLWIDGDHCYDAAKQDFALFSPWLLNGAPIAFHDATQGELPRVVVECFGAAGFVNIGLIDSIAYATKRHGARKTLTDWLMLWCLKSWPWLRRVRGITVIQVPLQRALAKRAW